MTCKINRTYIVVAIILLTIFSALPVFSACAEGPGDMPPVPCPDVETYIEIQGSLNKTSMEVMQCCHNPNGSDSFSGQDWADYLGISVSSSDVDRITPKKYVMVMDEDNNCSWELQDKPTQLEGDHVKDLWIGSVDYTEPGDNLIECVLFNDIIKLDSNDCPITTDDDPIRILTCVVTVRERLPEQDTVSVPSGGSEPWYYAKPCVHIEDGTIDWFHCFVYVANSGIPGCGVPAQIDISETLTVNVNGSLSADLAESIALTIGISLQTSTTINRYFGPCDAGGCLYNRVRVYQRAVYSTRDVHITHFPSSWPCDQGQVYDTIIKDLVYEDYLLGVCESSPTLLGFPDHPDCQCPQI